MKRFIRVLPIVTVIAIFCFAVLLFFLNAKAEIEATQCYAEDLNEQAKHDQDFVILIHKLEKRNVIDNADKFISAYSQHAGYPAELIQNTISTFKKDPSVGLQIFAQLCLCFNSSGEASEAIREEVSTLFFKDREKFLSGLTGNFETESFNYLLDSIDYPTDISEAVGFDYKIENKKVVDYLKKHRLKDNGRVKQLIKKFEGKNH